MGVIIKSLLNSNSLKSRNTIINLLDLCIDYSMRGHKGPLKFQGIFWLGYKGLWFGSFCAFLYYSHGPIDCNWSQKAVLCWRQQTIAMCKLEPAFGETARVTEKIPSPRFQIKLRMLSLPKKRALRSHKDTHSLLVGKFGDGVARLPT